MKKVKFNWAVFNTETGFRLTEYSTHTNSPTKKTKKNHLPPCNGIKKMVYYAA